MQHRLIEIDLLLVLVVAVVLGIDRMRQELADVEQRIDHGLAVEVDRHVEGAAAQRVEERTGRQHALRDLEPDLAPLVDHPGGDILVGLVDVAVHQLEFEPLGARLLQQALRLGARFLDVGPEPGDLLQLLLGRRQRRAREDDAADRVHGGDLGERRRAVPLSIARASARRTRTSSNGFFLWLGVIRLPQFQSLVLHRDLVAELLDELDRAPTAAGRGTPSPRGRRGSRRRAPPAWRQRWR